MITYLKCRSPIMTYVDPQTKFVIQRGKIVKYDGRLTKTMQRWIRRGGLKKVEEALYLKQLEAEPKQKTEEAATKIATEASKVETEKEPETKPKDKAEETQPKKPEPKEEQPKEKEEAAKPARKPRKADKK